MELYSATFNVLLPMESATVMLGVRRYVGISRNSAGDGFLMT